MTVTQSDWLTSEIIRSISDYMNANQPDSVQEIASRNGLAKSSSAKITDFDVNALVLTNEDGTTLRIEWAEPLEHRGQIREELLALAGF